MRHFLTSAEANLIRGDWSSLLNSPEASTVTFRYKIGVNEDRDNAFNVSDYDSTESVSFTGKAIQAVVKERNEDLLKWGIMEIGDSIFYTDVNYDLSPSGQIDGSLEIVDPDGIVHAPIPKTGSDFYKYLVERLGDNQIAQVIPCKLKS